MAPASQGRRAPPRAVFLSPEQRLEWQLSPSAPLHGGRATGRARPLRRAVLPSGLVTSSGGRQERGKQRAGARATATRGLRAPARAESPSRPSTAALKLVRWPHKAVTPSGSRGSVASGPLTWVTNKQSLRPQMTCQTKGRRRGGSGGQRQQASRAQTPTVEVLVPRKDLQQALPSALPRPDVAPCLWCCQPRTRLAGRELDRTCLSHLSTAPLPPGPGCQGLSRACPSGKPPPLPAPTKAGSDGAPRPPPPHSGGPCPPLTPGVGGQVVCRGASGQFSLPKQTGPRRRFPVPRCCANKRSICKHAPHSACPLPALSQPGGCGDCHSPLTFQS